MLAKLKKMPADVQQVLGFAAQIGNQFERHLLAEICEFSDVKMVQLLSLAMQENFIISMDREFEVVDEEHVHGDLVLTRKELLPDSNGESQSPNMDAERQSNFRFGHDRIQQASAILVAEEQVPKIHFQVGERLLEKYHHHPKLVDEHLLFIVNHLNKG